MTISKVVWVSLNATTLISPSKAETHLYSFTMELEIDAAKADNGIVARFTLQCNHHNQTHNLGCLFFPYGFYMEFVNMLKENFKCDSKNLYEHKIVILDE